MQAVTLSAIDLFEHTYAAGWWYRLWAVLRRRQNQLLDLRDVVSERSIRAQRADGVQVVSISQIKGSEGRVDEFDAAFHPLQTYTESRWRSIALAWLDGRQLPPVELIRVDDLYFVRDGHHRISVARAMGQREIDAVVTIWQVEKAADAAEAPAATPVQQPTATCRNTLVHV